MRTRTKSFKPDPGPPAGYNFLSHPPLTRGIVFTRTSLIFLVVVLTIIRLIIAIYFGNEVSSLPGAADQVSYHNLAIRVLDGHGFSFDRPWWPATSAGSPTAHWSYLYTLYLVVIYHFFGVNPIVARLLQVLITGFLHPYLIYKISSIVLNKNIAYINAIITSIYMYFIYYSAVLMTESFYITFFLLSIYIAINYVNNSSHDVQKSTIGGVINAVLFGLSLGVTILLRQVFLILIPLIFIWILLSARQKLLVTMKYLLISTIIVGLLILPFTTYNYSRFHRFVLLNTNAGYAFYLANHPAFGKTFIPAREMEDYQVLFPPDSQNLDEAALESVLFNQGIQFLKEDFSRYISLSLSRIPVYFMFWPSRSSGLISNVLRGGSFGLLLPVIILGIGYWIKKNRTKPWHDLLRSPGTLLLGIAFGYSAIHILTWAAIRYRLPVDAILLIFAGLIVNEVAIRVTSQAYTKS